MNSNRKTAIMVGALFLFSNVTFLLGAFVFVEPILGAPDYLTLASANKAQVVLGALLEIVNGIAYVGIAVLVFPILRVRFESMALWYVCFRIIEFVMQTLSDMSPLTLVKVSETYVEAGAQSSASIEAIGTLLLAGRYWAFQMVTFSLVLGVQIGFPGTRGSRQAPQVSADIIGYLVGMLRRVLLPAGCLAAWYFTFRS